MPPGRPSVSPHPFYLPRLSPTGTYCILPQQRVEGFLLLLDQALLLNACGRNSVPPFEPLQ